MDDRLGRRPVSSRRGPARGVAGAVCRPRGSTQERSVDLVFRVVLTVALSVF